MLKSITLEIEGKKITLDVKKAKKLKEALNELFNEPVIPIGVYPMPYIPPMIPIIERVVERRRYNPWWEVTYTSGDSGNLTFSDQASYGSNMLNITETGGSAG